MALTRDTNGRTFPARTFRYSETDTILYALGIGAGADGDAADLPFVYEASLRAYPTQATVIAWDDSWIGMLGLNETLIVHGEQRVTLHRPLPPRATINAQARIIGLVDKGLQRGALLYVETNIEHAESGQALVTLLSTVFARGDGGFGGEPTGAPVAHHTVPDRAPDLAIETAVPLNQALVFRLCGDRNPLHVDPAFAKAAGFDRPIIHGLSTYGVAARTIIRTVLGNDPAPVEHVAARFSAPVFPGERVQTMIWSSGGEISFRMRVPAADRTVLDNGLIRLRS